MPNSPDICRSFVVAALLLSTACLSGCGAAPPTSAGPLLTPAATQAAARASTEHPPTDGPTPTDEAPDTSASSVTNLSNSRPETVRSTHIATLRLVPAAGGQSSEIRVDNVIDLYALDIQIKFDPTRLRVADADAGADGVQIQPGRAPMPDFVAINSVDSEKGLIRYVATQLGEVTPFSGSGVVATISWQSNPGENAAVALEAATLASKSAQPIESAVRQ